jgi:hypothetical protein
MRTRPKNITREAAILSLVTAVAGSAAVMRSEWYFAATFFAQFVASVVIIVREAVE